MSNPAPDRVGRLLFAILLAPLCLVADRSEWTDLDGNQFKGEPAGIFGPLALFRTSSDSGRHVPLIKLAPADCVRFYREIQDLPERADRWSEAEARLTGELPGRVEEVKDGRVVPADLSDRPEPKVMILFFGSHSEGRTWGMLGDAADDYRQLHDAMPGECGGLFYGRNHNGAQHDKIALDMNIPWLVTDYGEQRSLDAVRDFAAPAPTWVVATTRHGVPLATTQGEDTEAVDAFMARVRAFLEADQPDNPRTWPYRVYFFRHVQQALHEDGRSEPMAVGSALKTSALAEHGISSFAATLQVNADGEVTEAVVEPGPGIPDNLIPAVEQALLATPVVPAVDQGRFVAGSLQVRYP